MIRNIYILILFLVLDIKVSAQYRYEDFNKNIPENWSSNSVNNFSIAVEHYKDGNGSLKWKAKSGDELRVKDLRIPKAETSAQSATEIFVYSSAVSADTLIFQFLDNTGKLQRQGRMLLNYKGWRSYHRSFQFDYHQGVDQTAFELNECRMIYKSAKKAGTNIIYFDALRFAGNKATRREPAPHTALDKKEFKKIGLAGGNPLESWLNMPPSGIPEITENEAIAIKKIREVYKMPLRPVGSMELKEAMNYVAYSKISRNEDQSIKGRGITAIAIPDTLVKISNYCGILARAFLLNDNQEAKDALILFTEYLIDQGLAEGGPNVLPTNSYQNARTFPLGFLDALAVYPADMRTQVLAMLKWSHEYNQIYDENFMPGLNTDFIHLKLETLFRLALANPSDKEAVSDMKYLSRFLANGVSISAGGSDGIKPDGIGFHHLSAHMSYMVAFSSWIDQAYALIGTPFRISKQGYENMRLAVKTLLLQSAEGKMYPHSLSGRKPFTATVPVSRPAVIKLIAMGDDLGLQDNDLKAFYNYIYKENRYPVKKADLDGFYQFNYAQLGIFRKNNWVVAMRGFTDRMFGSEIYDQQNRYGRYQSYGSLEVLYNGSHSATGYIAGGKGWDWNVIPGTTTVHLPWNKLGAKTTTASEYQSKSFAGALSLDKNGIFGFDFVQAPEGKYVADQLTFRKSVFAFDRILVCLGSNISATATAGFVATNLFQSIAQDKNPPLYVPGTKSTWLINGVHTGYFIPKDNDEVEIIRGEQHTPDQTSDSEIRTNRSLATKAWINHGRNPAKARYHFVVVPETNPKEMEGLAAKFEGNKIFRILKQTDSAHIVKYIPDNLISYVFFEPQHDVDIGYVRSISAPALIGIKDEGDRITVTIADPDLQAKTAANSFWRSTESKVTLSLKGNWKVISNKFNARVQAGKAISEVTFSLVDGLLNEIILQREQKPMPVRDKQKFLDSTFYSAKKQYTELIASLDTYNKYPRSLDKNNTLKFDSGSDWTGGFWPGSLWFVYEYTANPLFKTEALKFTESLSRNQFNTKHHDVGFVMYSSYGNAYRLTNSAEYKKVLVQSAESLSSRYSPVVGSIQSWNSKKSWDGKTVWHFPVIIDNLMNLELLFFASKVTGNAKYKNIAIKHAETTMKNHIRSDYSSFHVVSYDIKTGKVLSKETAQGFSDNSTWARGQAWGIYGFTMVYRETRDGRFLETAQKMADFYLKHKNLPADHIPYWDFNVNQKGYVPNWSYDPVTYPIVPRDVSAASIVASALFELGGYSGKNGQKYIDEAIKILHILGSESYFNKKGKKHNFLLNHAVGNFPRGSEIDVPIIYADYYFLEALLRYKRSKF